MAKADAAAIKRFLEQLAREPWLGTSRADWPRHAYHLTDIQNAASILESGVLRSRVSLRSCDVHFDDCADQQVIANSEWSHGYVRLYFRPLTPTQYHMEGISPPHARRHGAHVPVPIHLLFDLPELLCEDGIEFSNGNVAAAGHTRGGDAAFLKSLDFRKIYHQGALADGPAKSEIIFMRCAEILMPGELPLTHLREIVCRTASERDTLLTLLGAAADDWRDVIRAEKAGEATIFNRRWHYVRDIRWDGKTVYINLSMLPWERRLTVRFRDGSRYTATKPTLTVGSQEQYDVVTTDQRIAVEYSMYDSLAYRGFLSQRQLFTR